MAGPCATRGLRTPSGPEGSSGSNSSGCRSKPGLSCLYL